MLFNKVLLVVSFSIVIAFPITERSADEGTLLARAPKVSPKAPSMAIHRAPANKGAQTSPQIQFYKPGSGIEEQARKANNAPGRKVPKLCKTWSDCSCPRGPSNQISSTSCINGACSCNNPIINFMDNTLIDGVAKVANSPVFQAMGQVFETFADVEEVAADVAGIFGPEAKAAAKAVMLGMPDVGPSHLDQLSHGILNKVGNFIR